MDTSHPVFHEAFWTTAATLGPVLALALAVFINRHDVLERLRYIKRRAAAAKKAGRDLDPSQLVVRKWSRAVQVSAWIGFGLGTVVTVVALCSLAATPPHDMWPPYAVFGILILAGATIPITALIDSNFQHRAEALRKRRKATGRKSRQLILAEGLEAN